MSPPSPRAPVEPNLIQVYGNEFSETENGAIKARNDPQGVICDNSCKDGDCDISEEG